MFKKLTELKEEMGNSKIMFKDFDTLFLIGFINVSYSLLIQPPLKALPLSTASLRTTHASSGDISSLNYNINKDERRLKLLKSEMKAVLILLILHKY
jgi:hypothetical protein